MQQGQTPYRQIAQCVYRRWIGFISDIKRKVHECGAEKEEEAPADKAARVTTRATVWMAIFTAILAIVGIGTYVILKNQLREMHQAGMDAEATKRLDQRAWIGVAAIGPGPVLGSPWELNVTFTNTGKTPAKKVHFACRHEPVATEDILKWESPVVYKPTLIPPNGQAVCNVNPISVSAVNQAVLDDLAKSTLFVYGFVTYQDIFDKWHWLTFCGGMTSDGRYFNACQNGNDTGDGDTPPPPYDKARPPN